MKFNPLSKKDVQLIKRAARYVKPYWFRLLLACLCFLGALGFGLLEPLIWAKILTGLFKADFPLVVRMIGYMAVVYSFQLVIDFFRSYVFSYLNSHIVYDIKRDMFRKILNLPVAAFDDMRVGEFISRLNGDAGAIANILTQQFLQVIFNFLQVFIIGACAFKISAPLSIITLCTFPISFFIFMKFGKVLRAKNMELAKVNDTYFSNIQETIAGIREIKSLGLKGFRMEKFLNLGNMIRGKTIRIGVLNTLSGSSSEGVNFVSNVATFALGGYLILKKALSVEYFIAFTAYSAQFLQSLMGLTSINSSIQQMMTSLERIFQIIDNLDYSQEHFGELDVDAIKGEIVFKDVCFQYAKELPVLNGLTFKARPHTKVAFVGKSGGGKSTIFNLLLRFYTPDTGTITIDGIDIASFNEKSLRKHIAVVRQDPVLFNLSIKENLTLADPAASMPDVVQACRDANIHDFVVGLPQGYETVISDNAVNISRGQRQKLAIARAILSKSKIILLDEATASLDNEAQSEIHQTLEHLAKDHTVLIIAHRLITVLKADVIVVVDQGAIKGVGTHDDLFAGNSAYRKLFEEEVTMLQRKQNNVALEVETV